MRRIIGLVCTGVLLAGFVMAEDVKKSDVAKSDVKGEEKKAADAKSESLFTLLTGMKLEKAKAKSDAEVSIPVDTSGTRGFEVSSRSLSPVWPSTAVTPLRALSHSIEQSHTAGESWSSMKLKLMEFEENYPEYKEHKLLGELESLLSSGK